MIDFKNMKTTVVKGLSQYLGCKVVRNNQNAEPPPYPYVSFTITTPATANNGTYGEYDDGKARKPVNCIWSITAQSNDNTESVTLANKAREWLDYAGTVYLNDNDVVVQSVGNVGNRDNVLTAEYEYKNGFDCVFTVYDVVDLPDNGSLETVSFQEDTNAKLEDRLNGVETISYSGNQVHENENELNELLKNRLNGEK